MDYHPDVWVIMELTGTEVQEGRYYRVLAGWYGGFAGADSWKASSGIVKIVDCGTYWEIHNFSGSVYYCNKECERLSSYTASILNSFIASNSDDIAVRQVLLEEVNLAT